jgi:hypothetical protein
VVFGQEDPAGDGLQVLDRLADPLTDVLVGGAGRRSGLAGGDERSFYWRLTGRQNLDLYWRAAGTVGHPSKYLRENDIGPDDAVHDWNGIIIYKDPRRRAGRPLQGARLIDVAPTVLRLMGASVPSDIDGVPIRPILELSEVS